MARFPSGVTIVTTRDADGRGVGFTASAFSSLSLDPPLLLVCLQNDADCYAAFMAAEQFAVSILSEGQGAIALHFARKQADKLAGQPLVDGETTGLPLVRGASAHLECRMHSRADGGDHTILVGKVLYANSVDTPPLLVFNRTFGGFCAEEAT